MKHSIWAFTLIGILFSCQTKQENKASFIDKTHASVTLSQLMTDSVQMTPLETNDESLVGRINKIEKRGSHYYILSNDQWIHRFNENGEYVSQLNKRGNGPEEYSYINDFDVYQIDGEPELWVADNQNIKIYGADDLAFRKKITFPFIVNKFRRVNKDEILIMTCQDDHALFITDEKGEVKNSFLKKEVPYLLFRAIQFKSDQKSSYYFQLGVSNNYVVYDSTDHSFKEGIFFQTDDLLSQNKMKSIFDKYGQDFIPQLADYNYIQSFIYSENNSWFHFKCKGKTIISKTNNNQLISATIYPKCNIKNDLFNIDTFDFLTTIGFGESDNSLLLYMDLSSLPESTNQIVTNKGQIIQVSKEDNPCIIEFFNR